MTETTRIRWEPTQYGGWTGHVGTLEPWAYQIWKPGDETPEWRLTSALFGQYGRRVDNDNPGALKAEAECWLEDFVSSLGASFGDWPDCSAVARFETIDHTRGLASVSPASTRAVVVYGARVEFSLQDDGRTLKVFLTDPAKADQDAAPAAAGEKE